MQAEINYIVNDPIERRGYAVLVRYCRDGKHHQQERSRWQG